ncbi:MAG: hypothetical protein ACK5LK_04975 [Chthoniobacterales bacterium]
MNFLNLPVVFVTGTLFLGLSACSTTKSPAISSKEANLSSAFTGYVFNNSDKNGDDKLAPNEWKTAGGTPKNFARIDKDGNGLISPEELKTATSTDEFYDFVKDHMILNDGVKLTPNDFDPPTGIKLLSHSF